MSEPTAEPQDLALRIEDLHKSFGAKQVLCGLNIEVPRGSTFVILGPSGTGKSVTLRHIVGLIPPDRGRVWAERRSSLSLAQVIEIPVVTHELYAWWLAPLDVCGERFGKLRDVAQEGSRSLLEIITVPVIELGQVECSLCSVILEPAI